MAAGRAGRASFKLSNPEVVASVKSLCADELKPYGRVLLKRLRERAAETAAAALGLSPGAIDPDTMPKIDPKQLRKVCQRCPQLRVDAEDGQEFSVTLVGCRGTFLDVCSQFDPYPQEMWLAARTYIQSLSDEDMYLPGGRYACARALAGSSLPFLAGFSLGQICHIVQLAISQKQILGHMKGHLVPYSHSENWLKQQHALYQQPLGAHKSASFLPIATWDEVREHLMELLEMESNPERGVVTLSNVKRLFRSHFQLELSETALGHPRVFDLLQDVRLHDICIVQTHGNGQLLVRRRWAPQCARQNQDMNMPHLPKLQISPLSYPAPTQIPQTSATTSCKPSFAGSFMYPSVPIQLDNLPPRLAVLRMAEFDLDMAYELGGLSPGASPRGCRSPWNDAADCCKQFVPSESELSDHSTDVPCTSSDDGCEVSPRSEGLQTAVKNTFIEVSLPRSACAGSRRRLQSVPRDMYSRLSA